MKKKRLTSEERKIYWTAVIEAARQWPQGVTAYCTEHGVSKDNFYSWFKKLRPEHPEWTPLPNPHVRRKEAARATRADEPATQVVPINGRRRFTNEFKQRILQETDGTSKGEIAAILRREGLYYSHLSKWRTERAHANLGGKPGRSKRPLASENRSLRAENARLQKRIRQQELLLELQKKVSEILNVNLDQGIGAE